MIEFILTNPDDLPSQALAWLQISVNKTPGGQNSLQEIIEHCKKGNGSFYLVKSEKIIGAIYLEWMPDVLNIVLMGGDYIKDWRNEMNDFCVSLIRERGIKTIMFCGRYGLGKIFPQFESIGILYVLRDGG